MYLYSSQNVARYTSINQCVKDFHLSSVTMTTPNLYQKWPKFYQRQLPHFFMACFDISENVFATSENLSTNNLFKKTTCLIWSIYIGPQDGHIRSVWLYNSLTELSPIFTLNPFVFFQKASLIKKYSYSEKYIVVQLVSKSLFFIWFIQVMILTKGAYWNKDQDNSVIKDMC